MEEDMHVQTFISGGGVQNILFKGGPPNFLAKKIFLEQKYELQKQRFMCVKLSPKGQNSTRIA